MRREELLFVATCDIAGQVRGKAYPTSDIDARRHKGVGWTHSNSMQTAFGPILDTPFGTAGDLMIVADPNATVRVDFADDGPAEHFALGDIRNTDGSPWECCPRHFLRRAVAALEEAGGVSLLTAFEQEFVYTGVEDRPGHAYSLGAFRRQGIFGEALAGALQMAGLTPDSFLPEYGARQFEVTISPRLAMVAADQAVITREMARATAHRLGHRVIFSPMPAPDGVGNGVHIHFSLQDASRTPLTWDPAKPFGLSDVARRFCAGVLHHLPAICAVTAPSPVSYLRLTPNRWAPTRIDLLANDRGAALRVSPVFAARDAEDTRRQYNVEFRVADATASPYLALGALIMAGADGIRNGMEIPDAGADAPMLPGSLGDALDLLAASETVCGWFGPVFLEAYLRHKRSEIAHVAGLSPAELCARYAEVY
jgi:glutamine synthetase